MEPIIPDPELEALNTALNDPDTYQAYKKVYEEHQFSWVPQVLAALLVGASTLVYGQKPSYSKFRAIEIIARVPYHSWAAAVFTMLTLCFSHEQKALQLSRVARFARLASDNETMHVVVISQLAKQEERVGQLRGSVLPMLFAFLYFWISYMLYLVCSRWSYQLNALFENHAFEQYNEFLVTEHDALKKKGVESDFLRWYGRNPINQYDFFTSVRNDELIHRNQSLHATCT